MTQITIKDFTKLAQKYEDTTAKDLELMHQTVAKNTDLTEFRYFLNVAKAHNLNPFKKEIWCYKDGKGNQIIFAGRDGFLKKAQENPAFAGIRSCEVRKNDIFEANIADGVINHKITTLDDTERGDITGAYAIVYRKDGEPTIEFASWKTYNKVSPKYSSPWSTHSAEMIKKVAESHALKKAFGISGLQLEEDFNIKEDKALPVGTEVAKTTNPQVTEAVSKVFENMKKRLETATTSSQLEKLKGAIQKQIELNLLSEDAVQELETIYQNKSNKLNEAKEDGK